jgi:hypothetical protein
MVRTLIGSLLALAVLGAQAAYAQGEVFPRDGGPVVVVELFTSQACPSCPEADAFAADLDNEPDIFVLSWPVDIWDYLGWEDTLASPENTRRQAQYNGRFGLRWPYTPELVIDGRTHVAGNQREAVMQRIEEVRRDSWVQVPLRVRMMDGRLVINVGAAPEGLTDELGTVWLIPYRDHNDVEVAAGPNAGHTLSYVNVAEMAVPISQWAGTPVIVRHELDQPLDAEVSDAPDGYVILLQKHRNGPILGATRLQLRWNGADAQ